MNLGPLLSATFFESLVAWTRPNLDRATLHTAATLVATSAVLFFTITLIPFQQYATIYSPSLLRYIRTDLRLIISYAAFFLLILISLGLLFFPITFTTAIVAVACVCGAFVLIGTAWLWSSELLDPRRVLPRIESSILQKLRLGFGRLNKRGPPEPTVEELKEMMRQTMNTHDGHHSGAQRIAVPAEVVAPIAPDLRLLQELCGRFLQGNQVDLFEAALGVQIRCLFEYLSLRRSFVGHLDQTLIDFADTLRDYVAIARELPNVHPSRIIWRSTCALAIRTLSLDVVGARQGYHLLANPLSELMRESILRDLADRRSDGAFECTRALGNFATAAGGRGYCQTAADLIETLAGVTRTSAALGQSVVTYIGKKHVAAASFATLGGRVLVTNYDFPFDSIIKAYDSILSDAGTANTTGLTDPMTWPEPDLQNDVSIGGMVRIGLFPEEADDALIQHNLSVVRKLIGLLQKHCDRSALGASSGAQLYQSGLWLIAFIDKELTLELLLYRDGVPVPSKDNRAQGVRLLGDLLDWMLRRWVQYARREVDLMFGDELLESVLSLYAILMGCDRPHSLGLTKWLDRKLSSHLDFAIKNVPEERMDDSEWVGLRSFLHVMKHTGACPSGSKRLAALVRRAGPRHASYLRATFTHIRRPVVTFRQDAFGDLDRLAFGEPERAIETTTDY